MNKTWMWIFGVVIVLGVVGMPLMWSAPTMYGRYPMMGNGYGWHMPMIAGGYGMMGAGMSLMWLIQFGAVILIGLGIAALTKYLKTAN